MAVLEELADFRATITAEKRERLAELILSFLAEDDNRCGFLYPTIISGQPETVLVEFQSGTFAITVEDA